MNAVVTPQNAEPGAALWSKYERRIALTEVLDALVAEGMVEPAQSDKMKLESRMKKSVDHPLVQVAAQAWKSLKTGKPLTLDFLSEWLAAKAGMEYFHVDPLKIDFTRVGEMMTITYPNPLSILPIDAHSKFRTIVYRE